MLQCEDKLIEDDCANVYSIANAALRWGRIWSGLPTVGKSFNHKGRARRIKISVAVCKGFLLIELIEGCNDRRHRPVHLAGLQKRFRQPKLVWISIGSCTNGSRHSVADRTFPTHSFPCAFQRSDVCKGQKDRGCGG